MRDINLWTYHSDFGLLCPHAVIDDAKGVSYPSGTQQGQADWHVAVKFSSLAELAKKLSDGIPMPRQYCGNWFRDCDPIQRGEIVRLAIHAHGDQNGLLYINGRHGSGARNYLSPETIASYHADLHTVGLYTRVSSTILIMACMTGQGPAGTRLLIELSNIWPGRKVVGFSTIQYRHPGAMSRPGGHCELPGGRDTDARNELEINRDKWDRLWKDLVIFPWGSEFSPHAKVVSTGEDGRGHVLRCPAEDEEQRCELLEPKVAPPKAKATTTLPRSRK